MAWYQDWIAERRRKCNNKWPFGWKLLECLKKCIEIHDLLENQGIETIFDNRDESAGRKFSDADLIGVPFQLIVGPRELKNGNVELKNRKTDAKEILSFDSAINKIKNKIFEE